MKKLLLLSLIFVTSLAVAQDTPCDAKYGKATAMPEEGWCAYAENLRKAGKPSASAECRCENGKRGIAEQNAKREAEAAKQKAIDEKYNSLDDKYQAAMKEVRDMTEEQGDKKISVLTAILPVAEQLDNMGGGGGTRVTSINADLEYLERQKRQRTVTIGGSNANGSSTNSSQSEHKTKSDDVRVPYSGPRKRTALDGYYESQRKIKQIDESYAKMQNKISNIIDQAFGTEPVGYDKVDLLQEAKNKSEIRNANHNEYKIKIKQRTDIYNEYLAPIKEIDDFFDAQNINKDTFNKLLSKLDPTENIYFQVINSNIDYSSDFLRYTSYDETTYSNSGVWITNTPPSAEFIYSRTFKIRASDVIDYKRFINFITIDLIRKSPKFKEGYRYILISSQPTKLEQEIEQLNSIFKNSKRIKFNKSVIELDSRISKEQLLQTDKELKSAILKEKEAKIKANNHEKTQNRKKHLSMMVFYYYKFGYGKVQDPKTKHYGVVNSFGDIVIPMEYPYLQIDGIDKITVSIVGKFDGKFSSKSGVVNQNNEVVIPIEYDYLLYDENETFYKAKKSQRYGIIDSVGETIVPFIYESIGEFSENLASVEKNGKYGYINSKGKLVIPFKDYDDVEPFNEGLARIRCGKRYGFINTDGKLVIPCKYKDVSLFSEGLAYVKSGRKFGFINTKGELVIPFKKYDEVRPFTEGLSLVKSGERYGFLNTKGELAIPLEYKSATNFSEGLASVTRADDTGDIFINKNGQIIIKSIYPIMYSFHEGLAAVKQYKDGKYGFINTKGETVIPLIYDRIYGFKNGKSWVKINNEYMLINKKGEKIGLE